MTPWQSEQAIAGYRETRKAHHLDQAWLAYHIAGLTKMDNKKWPAFRDFAGLKKEPSKSIDEAAIKLRLQEYSKRYKENDNRSKVIR